jgi:hypothetical protein
MCEAGSRGHGTHRYARQQACYVRDPFAGRLAPRVMGDPADEHGTDRQGDSDTHEGNGRRRDGGGCRERHEPAQYNARMSIRAVMAEPARAADRPMCVSCLLLSEFRHDATSSDVIGCDISWRSL